MDEARSIREFWFGREPLTAAIVGARMRAWFGDEDAERARQRDAEIRIRFGGLLERAASGALASWEHGPRRRLSLILLLDQFPRHIFRGAARAFAYDQQALALALSGMQSGADAALEPMERIFFYMPLQHAESVEVQDESVAAFRRLAAESPAELREFCAEALRWAEHHRGLVERFGRFPHRNRTLGRADTPAEEAWLRDNDQ